MNRRSFLQRTGLAAVGAFLAGWVAPAQPVIEYGTFLLEDWPSHKVEWINDVLIPGEIRAGACIAMQIYESLEEI